MYKSALRSGLGGGLQGYLCLDGLAARLRAAFGLLISAVLDESDRWFLWLPVGLGAGIAVYFMLPTELPLLAALSAWCILAGAGLLLHGWWPSAAYALIIPVIMLSGFTIAKMRTDLVSAPVLYSQTRAVSIQGWVEASEKRPGGGRRLVVRPERIERLKPDQLPRRIRLTMRKSPAGPVQAGDAIRFRAILMPPPDAVRPGGFSYARLAWFEQIGATGFVLSGLAPVQLGEAGFTHRLRAAITRWRMAVAQRLRAGLEERGGEVAAALIAGARGGLPVKIRDALRDAGLAHLLAISGLHMALFGGGLFVLIRWILALSPRLALGAPIKKWAALSAMAGSAGYLVLSGGSIATQRAFIMTSIMFLAVVIDRRGISMRNVALAAILILVWRPESLMSVSFQMSFGAVVALIAVYETGLHHGWFYDGGAGRLSHNLLKTGRYLAGLALTSLVAGAATAPFALYHFHRVAVYGLLGNMLAVPIMGFIIMPAALVTLIAMPFGLEAYPLMVMGFGIELVISVSEQVAQLPGAVRHVAAFSMAALGLMVIGGLFMALWRRWRYLGLVPLLLGVVLSLFPDRPDVLITRDGKNIAIRSAEGVLSPLSARKARYSLRKWFEADGDPRALKQVAKAGSQFSCDRLGCIATVSGDIKLAYIRRRDALQEDCRIADIVVVNLPVRKSRCAAPLVITRNDLKRNGAYALFVSDKGKIRVQHAAGQAGNRPWGRRARLKAAAASKRRR